MRKSLLFPLFFLVLSLIPCVYADSGNSFDFWNIPQKVQDALGLPSLFSAQLIVCGIILFMFLLPCAIWSKGNPFPSIVLGITMMSLFISIGWMPYWILLVVAMITALMFAGKIKDLITGHGEEE